VTVVPSILVILTVCFSEPPLDTGKKTVFWPPTLNAWYTPLPVTNEDPVGRLLLVAVAAAAAAAAAAVVKLNGPVASCALVQFLLGSHDVTLKKYCVVVFSEVIVTELLVVNAVLVLAISNDLVSPKYTVLFASSEVVHVITTLDAVMLLFSTLDINGALLMFMPWMIVVLDVWLAYVGNVALNATARIV